MIDQSSSLSILVSLLSLVWGVFFLFKRNIGWLICGMFLLSPAIKVCAVPTEIYIKRFLCLLLIILYFRHKILENNNSARPSPVKFPPTLYFAEIVMLLGSILLLVFDSRFGVMFRGIYVFLDAMNVYLPLFLVFYFTKYYCPKVESLYKPVAICTAIVVIYGLFNFLTDMNPVQDFFASLEQSKAGMDYSELAKDYGAESVERNVRTRVSSLYRYSFDFGLNCCFLFLVLLYFLFRNKRFSQMNLFTVLLAFVGVFMCGSRTVVLALVGGTMMYLFFVGQSKRKILILVASVMAVFLAYLFIPAVSNMVDLTFESLFGDSKVMGSSMSMRRRQLIGSLKYFAQNPIWGNGYHYIFHELGWGKGVYQRGMAGYESLLFGLLIERGLIGIVAYTLFIISLYIYFFIRRKVDHALSALGLGITTTFFLFAFGTGALDGWFNSMGLLGFIAASIEIKRHQLGLVKRKDNVQKKHKARHSFALIPINNILNRPKNE